MDNGPQNPLPMHNKTNVYLGQEFMTYSKFKGSIDEALVYNRILSEEEILCL